MAIASQSGKVLVLERTGHNSLSTWGLFGFGEYTGGDYATVSFVYRRTVTTDAAGGTALSFSITGASTAVFDDFYYSWRAKNADGQGVSLSSLSPRFYLSTSSSYSASAAKTACTVSGTTVSGSLSRSLAPNTTYYLFLCVGGGSGAVNGSFSAEITGSSAAAAQPAASGGYFGESLGISLSGGGSGARYTVTASCAGHTQTLQTKGSAAYLSWTPALSVYGPLLPDSASASAVIRAETFYGSVSAGSGTCTVTLRFRAADVRPVTASGWYAHAPCNAGLGASIARYIQGVSRAQFSFDANKVTARYGASITGYRVSCGGESDSSSPWRTPVLTGQSSVTVTAVDSRGFTASETLSITPLTYAAPTLSGIGVFRCDASGAADEDGTCCSVCATAACSPLAGDNSVALCCRLRSAGGSWGSARTMSSGQALILSGLDPDVSCEVKLEAEDAVGSVTAVTRPLRTRKWAMKFRPGGEGVAFGKAAETDKALELPADWDLKLGSRSLLRRSVSITKDSGFDASSFSFTAYVAGQLALLSFNIHVPQIGSEYSTMCSIAAACLPTKNILFTLCGQKGGAYLLRVGTDGTVKIYGGAGTTASQYLRGTVVIPIQ